MDLLNRIEALLKEKRMTKLEFAEKTGVNVFKWNEEVGNPSYQKLEAFAHDLVSPSGCSLLMRNSCVIGLSMTGRLRR
ncbi:MAG: hypothetical protein IKH26_03830 [Bacteroidaceae bacterium]|nr:hypothetical protein [Bacteroidaceae bacterium]